jgi:hypothetical protein
MTNDIPNGYFRQDMTAPSIGGIDPVLLAHFAYFFARATKRLATATVPQELQEADSSASFHGRRLRSILGKLPNDDLLERWALAGEQIHKICTQIRNDRKDNK